MLSIFKKKFIERYPPAHNISYNTVVLNGISSNTNIADSRHWALQPLTKELAVVDQEPGAQCRCAVIMLCSEDGFFTNAAGIQRLFSRYANIRIELVIFTGFEEYECYKMPDVLEACAAAESGSLALNSSPAAKLVSTWIGVSLNKEMVAQALRDNKKMMPRQRNFFDLGFDTDSEEEEGQRKDTEVQRSGSRKVIKDVAAKKTKYTFYAILQDEHDQKICPIAGCLKTAVGLEALRDHVLDHCKRAGKCVLCKGDDKDPFSSATILVKPQRGSSSKWSRPAKEHVQQHLPPLFRCPVADCSKQFVTEPYLKQHMESHLHNEKTVCPHCGASIAKTYVKQHLKEFCPNNNALKTAYHCADCKKDFATIDRYNVHRRTAHDRRDEIIGIAENSGLLDAGIPGLKRPVSVVIEESAENAGNVFAQSKKQRST